MTFDEKVGNPSLLWMIRPMVGLALLTVRGPFFPLSTIPDQIIRLR